MEDQAQAPEPSKNKLNREIDALKAEIAKLEQRLRVQNKVLNPQFRSDQIVQAMIKTLIAKGVFTGDELDLEFFKLMRDGMVQATTQPATKQQVLVPGKVNLPNGMGRQ